MKTKDSSFKADDLARIRRYLKDQMTVKEKNDFEHRLKHDQLLSKEVKLLRMLMIELQSQSLQQWLKKR